MDGWFVYASQHLPLLCMLRAKDVCQLGLALPLSIIKVQNNKIQYLIFAKKTYIFPTYMLGAKDVCQYYAEPPSLNSFHLIKKPHRDKHVDHTLIGTIVSNTC